MQGIYVTDCSVPAEQRTDEQDFAEQIYFLTRQGTVGSRFLTTAPGRQVGDIVHTYEITERIEDDSVVLIKARLVQQTGEADR